MKKNFFYQTGVDITNAKSMFEFINEHFTYDTMNSWNQLKSIANKVKVYSLQLDGDCWNALGHLENDNYFTINMMIEDWEADHPGYVVGFNGRSSGYLVLYNKENYRSIVPDDLLGYDNYDEFKRSIKESWYGEYVKDYLPVLRRTTKLIQDFDKLCDELRDYVNVLSLIPLEEEPI